MPRSMTGFSRARTETPEFSLTLSVKSVNHRFLDVQVRMPPELDAFEPALRRAIRGRIARGHVQVSAALETRAPAEARIDRRLVDAYLTAYRQLAREHGLGGEPDLNAVLRLPGIVTWNASSNSAAEGLEKALLHLADRALDELGRAREREAAGIVEDIERRATAIESALQQLERLRDGVTPRLAERLAERMGELLRTAGLDPQRILQEAALAADRGDISEELQRLRAHCGELRALVAQPGEIGKRVDFVLQEMARESNTLVSKTGGLGETGLQITALGLTLRAEIEKIREQAMNLE